MSSYQALYRKFRPQTFEDVKGQEHIVTTLQNQIEKERMSHAYLFCGTRGTGKTTIAKIFAKAVNCENLQDGNPCNLQIIFNFQIFCDRFSGSLRHRLSHLMFLNNRQRERNLQNG